MRPRYDCLKCPGYCCSYGRIAVSEHDIARLAKHFELPLEEARTKFTYHYLTKEVDEQVLRQKNDPIFTSICRFFDTQERRCTVYEARPNVCRRYPHGAQCGYYDFLKFEREQQGDEDYIAVT
jgi:Fe-S-cluster containining protein